MNPDTYTLIQKILLIAMVVVGCFAIVVAILGIQQIKEPEE